MQIRSRDLFEREDDLNPPLLKMGWKSVCIESLSPGFTKDIRSELFAPLMPQEVEVFGLKVWSIQGRI